MNKFKEKFKESPAVIISVVALVFAMTGGAYAAGGWVNGHKIKNGTISAKKLSKSAKRQLHGQRGKRGKKGDTGPRGERGEQGAQGLQGEPGVDGAQGPVGETGPAGESSLLTVSASTEIIDWLETSGWALDSMTRTLNLTRNYQVPSGNCGGPDNVAACWFYTAAVNDDGYFTTIPGEDAPNHTLGGVIADEVTGTMKGDAVYEFYASTDTPNVSLVPGVQVGRVPGISTSGWAKLAFPEGTVFANSTGNSHLVGYEWVYSAGCDEQTWTYGITPGDDGQNANDGNITGSCE